MKNTTSIIIGFLIATSMFLFMGQTKSNQSNARYQISNFVIQGYNTKFYETTYDTFTGKVIDRKWFIESDYSEGSK